MAEDGTNVIRSFCLLSTYSPHIHRAKPSQLCTYPGSLGTSDSSQIYRFNDFIDA